MPHARTIPNRATLPNSNFSQPTHPSKDWRKFANAARGMNKKSPVSTNDLCAGGESLALTAQLAGHAFKLFANRIVSELAQRGHLQPHQGFKVAPSRAHQGRHIAG